MSDEYNPDDFDPEWAAMWASLPNPGPPPQTAEGIRDQFNGALIAMSKLQALTDPGITTRDETINEITPIRIYNPPNSDSKKLPLIVFLHGGGWRAGNLDTEDHTCRIVCGRVECVIVSVNYQDWPIVEHPVQIKECYDAFEWAYDHADSLGADSGRVSIWGGSAGASLAIAVVAQLIASGKGDHVRGLVAMCGMFIQPDAVPEKYRHLHTSYIENGGNRHPFLPAARMLGAYTDTIGSESRCRDTKFFPVAGASESLKGFPRTYVFNTETEPCRDDGRVLEAGLKDVGVSVKRDVFPALPHYFWCFPLPKANERFSDALVRGVEWVIKGDM